MGFKSVSAYCETILQSRPEPFLLHHIRFSSNVPILDYFHNPKKFSVCSTGKNWFSIHRKNCLDWLRYVFTPWRSHESITRWEWCWKYRFFKKLLCSFSLYSPVNGLQSAVKYFISLLVWRLSYFCFRKSVIQISLRARIWDFCWLASFPFILFRPMNHRAESSINHENEAQNLVTGPYISTRPENKTFRNNTWKWNLVASIST
jgi:hypothetical protein